MTPALPPQDEVDDVEIALPPLGGSADWKNDEGVIRHHPFGLLYPQQRTRAMAEAHPQTTRRKVLR